MSYFGKPRIFGEPLGLLLMRGGAGAADPYTEWTSTLDALATRLLHWSAAGNVYSDTGATTIVGDGEACKAQVDPVTSHAIIEANTANSPVWRASVAVANNKPCLEFGGSHRLQKTSAFDGVWVNLDEYAVFIVGQVAPTIGTQKFIQVDRSNLADFWIVRSRDAAADRVTLEHNGSLATNTCVVSGTGGQIEGAFNLYSMVRTAPDSETLRVNGGTVGTNTATTASGTWVPGRVAIGADLGFGAPLTGYIADIIAFGADGVTNLAAIEAAINERYAIW